MSWLGNIVRRFKVKLIFEKKLKKSRLKSEYNNTENINKIDYNEAKLNKFMVDSDIKVYVLIPKKGNEVYNYLNTVGVSLDKNYSNYINNIEVLGEIKLEFSDILANQVKHPVFLIEKGDEIMYVTATHTARCDMLYLDFEGDSCRIVKERIEIVKKFDAEITVGVPYYFTNKANSLLYKILKDEKFYNSYELNSLFNEKSVREGSWDYDFFLQWYKVTKAKNGIELKEKVVGEMYNSRSSIINYNGELNGNTINYNLVSKEQIEFKTGYNKAVDCEKTLKDLDLDLENLTKNLNKKKF